MISLDTSKLYSTNIKIFLPIQLGSTLEGGKELETMHPGFSLIQGALGSPVSLP